MIVKPSETLILGIPYKTLRIFLLVAHFQWRHGSFSLDEWLIVKILFTKYMKGYCGYVMPSAESSIILPTFRNLSSASFSNCQLLTVNYQFVPISLLPQLIINNYKLIINYPSHHRFYLCHYLATSYYHIQISQTNIKLLLNTLHSTYLLSLHYNLPLRTYISQFFHILQTAITILSKRYSSGSNVFVIHR